MTAPGVSVRSARDVRVQIRAAALGCAALVVVVGWLVVRGLAPQYALAVAAVPAFVAAGYRYGYALLVGVLIVRPLVDNAAISGLNSAIAIGVVLIGALCALHDVRALILLVLGAVAFVTPSVIGHGSYGFIAIQEGVRLLSVVAFAAVTLVVPAGATRTGAARVVQVSALVPALVAIFQAATGTGTTIGATDRASGTLSQSNPAAFYFAVAALATLFLVFEGRTRKTDLAMLALFAVAIVTTGSITGLLTFVVGLLVLVGLARGLTSRSMWMLVLGLLVLITVALASPVGQGRLAEYAAPASPQADGNSLLWRFWAWNKILTAWRTSPVLGLGFGATLPGGILQTQIAHNEYIWILAEMGLVGLVVVLACVVGYLGFLRRFVHLGASPMSWALSVTLVVMTAIDSAADNTLHFTPSLYVLAFLLTTSWRVASRERAAAEGVDPQAGAVPLRVGSGGGGRG